MTRKNQSTLRARHDSALPPPPTATSTTSSSSRLPEPILRPVSDPMPGAPTSGRTTAKGSKGPFTSLTFAGGTALGGGTSAARKQRKGVLGFFHKKDSSESVPPALLRQRATAADAPLPSPSCNPKARPRPAASSRPARPARRPSRSRPASRRRRRPPSPGSTTSRCPRAASAAASGAVSPARSASPSRAARPCAPKAARTRASRRPRSVRLALPPLSRAPAVSNFRLIPRHWISRSRRPSGRVLRQPVARASLPLEALD